MTEKRHPVRQAAGGHERAGQPPGLDHGAASLVATDSPDDPQGQVSRNRPQTSTAEGWRSEGKS